MITPTHPDTSEHKSRDPRFKTPPWRHQERIFDRFSDMTVAGLHMEQRTGKTWIAENIAAHKYRTGQIDSLLVIAPNSVHRMWVEDAIPEHMPDDVNAMTVLWQSSKMDTVKAKKILEDLLAFKGGLRILVVNIDAIITPKLKAFLTKFFFRKKVMTVIDESGDISRRSKRTAMALKIGRRSVARMTLDGTPMASGIMGLYYQMEFLLPGLLGPSYVAYQAEYCELEQRDVGEHDRLCPTCSNRGTEPICERCRGSGYVGRHEIQLIKSHKNLDKLQTKLQPVTVRILRSDCHDLPAKIRQKVYATLPPETRRVYDELRTRYITELKSGGVITASMILVRYLRLQQVSSGFLPVEAALVPCHLCGASGEECDVCDGLGVIPDSLGAIRIEVLGEVNARLNALSDVVTKLDGQVIIWCKFTYDIEAVLGLATTLGKTAVRYDGKTDNDARAVNVRKFQAREVDWLVGNAKSGGRGIDLAAANAVIYYSHDWSLRTRLQSEDRAISLYKNEAVLYVDCIVSDSIDEKIVNALRAGKNLSDLVIGDKPENWL